MNALFSLDKQSIRRLSVEELRKYVHILGYRANETTYDRCELETTLLAELENIHRFDDDSKSRSKDKQRNEIAQSMEKLSQLPDIDIINELRKRNIDFDIESKRNELISTTSWPVIFVNR